MVKSLSLGRQYALALGVGATGAGLVLLSVRQGWADVVSAAQEALPASSVTVTGQDLVPAAEALALVALAGLVGVIATKGRARQLVGAALAVFGLITIVAVSMHLSSADVLAASHSTVTSQAGSAISGRSPGSGGVTGNLPGVGVAEHVVTVSFPWRQVAVLGGLLVMAAGVAVMWKGRAWPTMSSRYDAPTGTRPSAPADAATLWEALSQGVDPTESGGPETDAVREDLDAGDRPSHATGVGNQAGPVARDSGAPGG